MSSRLAEARFPMVPIKKASKSKSLLRLDTSSRFIQDDVSFGLCVLLGLGEIVDMPMPHTALL